MREDILFKEFELISLIIIDVLSSKLLLHFSFFILISFIKLLLDIYVLSNNCSLLFSINDLILSVVLFVFVLIIVFTSSI